LCDHGKAYLSATFRAACRSLGISLAPAHPHTPTDKPVIERTLGSVATLFAQHVAGYVGSSVERRGTDAEDGAVWSMAGLQALLDEWIVVWLNRPHDGLRDPLVPGRALTPNERYAALIDVAGYVPVPLSPEDYVELLPAAWRVINSYGVKIGLRTYDSGELNPYRRQHSGIEAKNGRWEVRSDPYDISRIWIRNHHHGGWLSATWKHLRTAPAPFGEQAWNPAAAGRPRQRPRQRSRDRSGSRGPARSRRPGPRPGRGGITAAAPGGSPHALAALTAGRRTHRGHRYPRVAPPRTRPGRRRRLRRDSRRPG
jgi:putative transposase